MGEKYVVGIDSGTQSTRVIVFDSKGNQVSKGVAKHPALSMPRQGWAEHGKDDIWNALCEAAKMAMDNLGKDPKDIAAIGLSSQRGAVVPVDKDFNILYNPISWMDSRWLEHYALLGAMPDDYEPDFRNFRAQYSKMHWFKNHAPEIYEKIYKYLNFSGLMAWQMTGVCRDTISNNIGMPYDLEKWALNDDYRVKGMGLRIDQLPEPVLPGTVLGYITPEAAAQTGFPEGCPVVASSGDKQAELMGAGAIHEGQAYITLGTLSGLDIVSSQYNPVPDASYLTYLACAPNMYNFEASLEKGFWLISWFRDNLGMDLELLASKRGCSIEELLNEEAGPIPAGSEGLVVLPEWQPKVSRPFGKGMFIGFDDRHKRGHMFRALLEGIAFQLKINTDDMSAKLGINVNEITIGGGGSKSALMAQCIADVFGVPVTRTKESETCSLGAAICAAVGAGLYPTFDEAVQNMTVTSDVFAPIPENTELYKQLIDKVIMKIYPAMETILKDLIELTKDA